MDYKQQIDEALKALSAIEGREVTSIRALAKFMGVNYSLIYRWIGGSRIPTKKADKFFLVINDFMSAWNEIDSEHQRKIEEINYEFRIKKNKLINSMFPNLKRVRGKR